MEPVVLIGLGALFLLYFIPSFAAKQRNHRNADAICVLNIFLGWTLLGWVIALVWAMTDNVKPSEAREVKYENLPPVPMGKKTKIAGLSILVGCLMFSILWPKLSFYWRYWIYDPRASIETAANDGFDKNYIPKVDIEGPTITKQRDKKLVAGTFINRGDKKVTYCMLKLRGYGKNGDLVFEEFQDRWNDISPGASDAFTYEVPIKVDTANVLLEKVRLAPP